MCIVDLEKELEEANDKIAEQAQELVRLRGIEAASRYLDSTNKSYFVGIVSALFATAKLFRGR